MSRILQWPPERFFCFYTHSSYLFSTEQPKDPLTITLHFTKIYSPYNGAQGPVTSALISVPHSFSPRWSSHLPSMFRLLGFAFCCCPVWNIFSPDAVLVCSFISFRSDYNLLSLTTLFKTVAAFLTHPIPISFPCLFFSL